MKHAGAQALDALESLLQQLRTHAGLTERKRGAFYHKSSGFLHFHEDPAGLFADLKIGDDYQRFPVNSAAERTLLTQRVAALMQTDSTRRK
jgi:hypothetical protein